MDTAQEAPATEVTAEGQEVSQAVETAQPARPEWLLEKYKTVEDQAKAYVEAQKLIGKKQEVAVPDSYEFTLSEEVQGVEIDENSPVLSGFKEQAKALGLSQDQFNALANWYLKDEMQTIEQYNQQEAARLEAEKAALGPKAQARINDIRDWAQQHLSAESFSALREIASNAQGIKLIEELRGISREHGVPVTEIRGNTQETITPAKLEELQFAKDENGNRKMSTDPKYRAYVQSLMSKVYGNAPRTEIVGSLGR